MQLQSCQQRRPRLHLSKAPWPSTTLVPPRLLARLRTRQERWNCPPDRSHWRPANIPEYAFQYAGDRSRIVLQLHADPAGSANFTVWSWDVLQLSGRKYVVKPTGRGSANSVFGGDLIWAGDNNVSGTWYVEVEQNGPSASTYTLQASGDGIDHTLPPRPRPPTPTYSLPIPTPGI